MHGLSLKTYVLFRKQTRWAGAGPPHRSGYVGCSSTHLRCTLVTPGFTPSWCSKPRGQGLAFGDICDPDSVVITFLQTGSFPLHLHCRSPPGVSACLFSHNSPSPSPHHKRSVSPPCLQIPYLQIHSLAEICNPQISTQGTLGAIHRPSQESEKSESQALHPPS